MPGLPHRTDRVEDQVCPVRCDPEKTCLMLVEEEGMPVLLCGFLSFLVALVAAETVSRSRSVMDSSAAEEGEEEEVGTWRVKVVSRGE